MFRHRVTVTHRMVAPDGAATPCEECLTRHGVFLLASPGETCRRCGHTPTHGALTPREIRACLGVSP